MSYLIEKRMDPSRLVRELVKTSERVVEFLQDVPEMGRDTYVTFQKAEEELERIDKDIRDVTEEVSVATSRLVMGLIASSLIIFSALISSQPQGEIFGIPEFTFTGLAIATVLIIAILLSIWEEG